MRVLFMRVSFMKSGSDKIVYIVDSIRVGKKIKTVTVKRLGRLSELEKLHPNVLEYCKQQAAILTKQKKEEEDNFDIKFFTQRELNDDTQASFNAGYLFLQKIYSSLGLDKTCSKIMKDNKAEYDLNKILKDLVFSRILFPSSKLSTFELSQNYLEQPNYELHDVYRALDLLSRNIDLIQKEAYMNSSKICSRNTQVLYYDCTNFFFEIEQQDGFRNYGISKEHRPNPIVQFGLFMDGNGIPLAFNINPGNQSEQLSPRPTEKMIEKEFGLSKFIYCSDAGLGSYSNKWFNQLKERAFIVTQSLKKVKAYILDWALDDSNWNNGKSVTSINSNEIIYKSRPVLEEGTVEIDGYKVKTTIDQRIIVTYSPLYAAYQKEVRESQIMRAQKIINNPKQYDKYSSTDCKRFINNYKTNKDGEILNSNLSLNEKLIMEEAKFDGYYALVTNLEGNEEEIIKINHNRWQIEDSFRIMKTEFKSRPVYLQSENRIRAHFLTCYLALLVFRILAQKVNKNEKEHYTTGQIITTLREMNLFKLSDIGYAPNYKKTKLVERLCETMGIDLLKQAYRTTKVNKMIKSTN